MARIDLAYVHRFAYRHGHIRHYFRRPGYPRLSLPGLPGSTEFMAAYQAAMGNKALPIGASRTTPGSFDALIQGYYASSEFRQLADHAGDLPKQDGTASRRARGQAGSGATA